jgi:hypothetical protein
LNPDGSVPIGKTKLSAGEYSVEISSGTKTLLPFKAVIKSKKPKSSEDDESKFDDVDSSIKDEEKSNNEDSKNEDEVELVDLSETQKEQNVSTRYEKIGTQQNFDTKSVAVDQIDSVASSNLSESQKNINNALSDNNDEESQSLSYQKLQENQIQSANQKYESNSQNSQESSSQSGQIDNTQSPLAQSSNPNITQRQIDEVKGVSITPEPTPINKDVKGETSVTVPEYRSVSGNTEVVLNSDPGVSGDTTVPQITNTAARGTLNGISAPGTSNYEAQNLSSNETNETTYQSFEQQPQQIIQTDRIQNTSGSEDKSNTLSGTSLESDNYADQDIYKSVGSDTIDQNKINSEDSNESTDIVENNYSSDEEVLNKLTANRLQNDSNLSLEDSQKKLTNEAQTSLDYVSLPESNLYPDNKNQNLSESDAKTPGVTGDNTVIRNEYVGASGETNVNLSEGSQVRGETSVNTNPTLGVSGEFTNNTEFSKSASGTFDSRSNQQNQNKIISNTNQIIDGIEEKLSNTTDDTNGSIYKKLEPGQTNYDENVVIENNESNNQITLSRVSQNTSIYQEQNAASQTNPISQTQDSLRAQNNNQGYRNVTDEFGNVFQVDEFGNKISSPDFSYEEFDNTNNQEYGSNNLRYGTIDGISSVESQEANQTERSYKEASSPDVNYSDANQKQNANLQYGNQDVTYVSNRTAQPNLPGVSRLNKSDSSDTNQSQPSDKKINFIKKLSMSICSSEPLFCYYSISTGHESTFYPHSGMRSQTSLLWEMTRANLVRKRTLDFATLNAGMDTTELVPSAGQIQRILESELSLVLRIVRRVGSQKV